jgi:type IV pilus assembly protein PilZ
MSAVITGIRASQRDPGEEDNDRHLEGMRVPYHRHMVELRRHSRAPLDVPVEFVAKGSNERQGGTAKDISLGGMFIATPDPLPFNAELVVHVLMPNQKAPFAIPGVVRWTRPDGMGIQFGLIGAKETFVITELTRKHGI